MLKGVSEMIAVVLIIAFAVAVGGILSVWILSFSREQSAAAGREAELSAYCSRGIIELLDVNYCSTSAALWGNIGNRGSILLGKLRMNIILTNGTVLDYPLCQVDDRIIKCDEANLTVSVGDIKPFNLSSSSNYRTVRITTNCSAYSGTATHELEAGDIALSC